MKKTIVLAFVIAAAMRDEMYELKNILAEEENLKPWERIKLMVGRSEGSRQCSVKQISEFSKNSEILISCHPDEALLATVGSLI